MARATDVGKSDGQGTLKMSDTSRTLAKCTTVGVAKALITSAVTGLRMLPMRVITTNWIPISAAADDPTMT